MAAFWKKIFQGNETDSTRSGTPKTGETSGTPTTTIRTMEDAEYLDFIDGQLDEVYAGIAETVKNRLKEVKIYRGDLDREVSILAANMKQKRDIQYEAFRGAMVRTAAAEETGRLPEPFIRMLWHRKFAGRQDGAGKDIEELKADIADEILHMLFKRRKRENS